MRLRSLFYGAPGGRTFYRVKVPDPPGSGKDTAKGKGVRREAESEGSRRQTSDLTNRNHIEVAREGKTAIQAEAQ